MEDTPKIYNTAIMINVVREVKILRDKVWEILLLTTSVIVSLRPIYFLFSRTLSKITIVALMEYPTIVSIQAINVEPTLSLATA